MKTPSIPEPAAAAGKVSDELGAWPDDLVAGTTRQLDAVSRIKDDGITEAAHNREGAHVDDRL